MQCVGIGALVFAYHQHSIKRKVHRWLWLLAHRYQWMTCIYYTSMLKVWALLLDSGISIIHTMNITRPLWGNMYGAECSEKVEAKLLTGHSFEESLRSENIGNTFIWQMISIGEESGELVKMLHHCGHYYEFYTFKIYRPTREAFRTNFANCNGNWCSCFSCICYVSIIYVYC